MTPAEAHLLPILIGLFVAHLLVPGPNMLFLAASASRGGTRAATGFAVGTALGTALWAAAAGFGALHLLEGGSPILKAVSLVMGLALVALAAPMLLRAVTGEGIEAACIPGAGSVLGDVGRGVFMTLANVNEIVFWGAVMALMAEAGSGPVFCAVTSLACGAAALLFDLAFVVLVSGGMLGRLVLRQRRPLEFAMGATFAGTGVALALPL